MPPPPPLHPHTILGKAKKKEIKQAADTVFVFYSLLQQEHLDLNVVFVPLLLHHLLPSWILHLRWRGGMYNFFDVYFFFFGAFP